MWMEKKLKYTPSNIEQVLVATPYKAAAVRPPTTHHENYPSKTNKTCRTLIRDVLLWNPSYGRAKAGRPARTYIQQLYEDTGCSPKDQPEAMNDKEEWRESVRDIRAGDTTRGLYLLQKWME